MKAKSRFRLTVDGLIRTCTIPIDIPSVIEVWKAVKDLTDKKRIEYVSIHLYLSILLRTIIVKLGHVCTVCIIGYILTHK